MVARPLALKKAEEGNHRWSTALQAHGHTVPRPATAGTTGPATPPATDTPLSADSLQAPPPSLATPVGLRRTLRGGDDGDSIGSTGVVVAAAAAAHLDVDSWHYQEDFEGEHQLTRRLQQQQQQQAAAREASPRPVTRPVTRVVPTAASPHQRTASAGRRGAAGSSPDVRLRPPTGALRASRSPSPSTRLYSSDAALGGGATTLLSSARGRRQAPPEKWGPLGEAQKKERAASAQKGRDIHRTAGGGGGGGGGGGANTSSADVRKERAKVASARSPSPRPTRTESVRGGRAPSSTSAASRHVLSPRFRPVQIATSSEIATRNALVWAEHSERECLIKVFSLFKPKPSAVARSSYQHANGGGGGSLSRHAAPVVRTSASASAAASTSAVLPLQTPSEDRETLSRQLLQLYDSVCEEGSPGS